MDCDDLKLIVHQMSQSDQISTVSNEIGNINVKMRHSKHHLKKEDRQGCHDLVVTAIYNYLPNLEDELALCPGERVRVLSNDYRDSGTEGWWVGLINSQIGVFPVSYVQTDPTWLVINESIDQGDMLKVESGTSYERCKIPFSKDSFVDNRNNIVCNNELRIISSLEIDKMECLGSGAFGVVYHGKWNNKEVAVKTFSMFANEMHIYQEADYLSCLIHPNIVRLFGITIINNMGNQVALIMEYARGGALHTFLHSVPSIKLSSHTLLLMSKQIASGMKYLHNVAGICHRDLKSSNVLIKEAISNNVTNFNIANYTLLITDFGMARRTSELVSQQSKFGTLAYAAPEVCKQQGRFTVKSDVWSFGVLLWELWTMEIPYRDVEQPHLLYKIAIKNQTLYIPTGIPRLLASLMTSCWKEDRDLRPDFEEVVVILNRLENSKFMDISANDFFAIQELWRNEIVLMEKCNDESMKNFKSERDAYFDHQKQVTQAIEELQRREEDMKRREAVCTQAMGTINKFSHLFSILVANQLPHVSTDTINIMELSSLSPPIPPKRKLPFVGCLKFWGHTSTFNNSFYNCHDSSTHDIDNTRSVINISGPNDVQHVVHISQQDYNLASPALHLFPESSKMFIHNPKCYGKSIFYDLEEQNSNQKLEINVNNTYSQCSIMNTPISSNSITIKKDSDTCYSYCNQPILSDNEVQDDARHQVKISKFKSLSENELIGNFSQREQTNRNQKYNFNSASKNIQIFNNSTKSMLAAVVPCSRNLDIRIQENLQEINQSHSQMFSKNESSENGCQSYNNTNDIYNPSICNKLPIISTNQFLKLSNSNFKKSSFAKPKLLKNLALNRSKSSDRK